jgi:hypothetical protein
VGIAGYIEASPTGTFSINKAASGDSKVTPILLNETRFQETEVAAGVPFLRLWC